MSNAIAKQKTPFEDLMPDQSSEEKQAFRQRIKDEGGIHDPILLTQDGRVLDGHNRLREDPNVPTIIIAGSLDWSDAECEAFVIRANLGRRNLSHEQRKDVLATSKKTAMALKKEGKTLEQIAGMFGFDRSTVGKWFGKKGSNGNGPVISDLRVKVHPRFHADIAARLNAGEAAETVAADLKITPRRVRQITTMANKATERRESQERAAADLSVDTFEYKRRRNWVAENIGRLREETKALPEFQGEIPLSPEGVEIEKQIAELEKQIEEIEKRQRVLWDKWKEHDDVRYAKRMERGRDIDKRIESDHGPIRFSDGRWELYGKDTYNLIRDPNVSDQSKLETLFDEADLCRNCQTELGEGDRFVEGSVHKMYMNCQWCRDHWWTHCHACQVLIDEAGTITDDRRFVCDDCHGLLHGSDGDLIETYNSTAGDWPYTIEASDVPHP